ncbi:hypothetical protein VQ045_21775 [Aurantimonas sp. E1-2-R+4]|uniref:hypothetical protein n=1 Tax=Aurantimonas sp. E1-2-R+4 TaxID=3113714 RepID=UPI002F9315D8
MANNLHISYDLNSPGQDYTPLIDKIKTLGPWAKIHKSFWGNVPVSVETLKWAALPALSR